MRNGLVTNSGSCWAAEIEFVRLPAAQHRRFEWGPWRAQELSHRGVHGWGGGKREDGGHEVWSSIHRVLVKTIGLCKCLKRRGAASTEIEAVWNNTIGRCRKHHAAQEGPCGTCPAGQGRYVEISVPLIQSHAEFVVLK